MLRIPAAYLLIVCAVASMAGGGVSGQEVENFVPVTTETLIDPDPGDWLMASRTYDWQRFSPLDQINRDTVGQLQLVWVQEMEEGSHQNIPLVYGGVMYVAAPRATIRALGARRGNVIWEHTRSMPEGPALTSRIRSLAIYEDLIIWAAADGYLVALDARTGRLRWETKVVEFENGSDHTSGPIVADGVVVSGRSCNRERCFIAGHDARTGEELWRTYTTAAPGEPGGDTWAEVPVERRVASAWGTGSYDPVRRLVFWGVSNPSPYTRITRHHGNPDAVSRSTPAELYSNSTMALDPHTGNLTWYYQYLPGDDWDMDHVQERLLITSVVEPDPETVKWINPTIRRGEERDMVVTVGEPGGVWALDRGTGEFLWATPFPYDVPSFHISDIDVTTGRTFINWDLVAKADGEQYIICFHNTKGFWPMAYHPGRNSLYIPYNDYCLDQTADVAQEWLGHGRRVTTPRPGADPQALAGIAKVDMRTGQIDRIHTQRAPGKGAALATAGDLIFWGDLTGRFHAFDAETGEILWDTLLGGSVLNSTITYAVDGTQYVAVLTGRSGGDLLSYLPDVEPPSGGNAVYAFALAER